MNKLIYSRNIINDAQGMFIKRRQLFFFKSDYLLGCEKIIHGVIREMMTYEVNYSCLEPNRVGKANDDNGNNNPTFVKSLVGVSSSPCGEHFTMLPAEMVAEIMIRLPIVDVYRLANLTNTTWHQARFIISKRDALEKQELLRTVHSLNNSKALKK